jgi:transcriptional regulator with XRE-family HTH domain
LQVDALSKSAKPRKPPAYGRGTGVPDPVDVYVGGRVRTRRLLLGMNQEELARALGLTFQQVQKYESGANRVSASRLWEIAAVLKMPIGDFFPADGDQERPETRLLRERLQQPESIELIRFFYAIPDGPKRQQFLEMVRVSASPDRPTR